MYVSSADLYITWLQRELSQCYYRNIFVKFRTYFFNLLLICGKFKLKSISPNSYLRKKKEKKLMFPKAALSNTGIPRVQVASSASGDDDQPEVDISDEEFLQFDTSGVPVVVTLTKVT